MSAYHLRRNVYVFVILHTIGLWFNRFNPIKWAPAKWVFYANTRTKVKVKIASICLFGQLFLFNEAHASQLLIIQISFYLWLEWPDKNYAQTGFLRFSFKKSVTIILSKTQSLCVFWSTVLFWGSSFRVKNPVYFYFSFTCAQKLLRYNWIARTTIMPR